MNNLLKEVRGCVVCAQFLPFEPRPIVQASTSAKVLIIGQAPGQKVNTSGVPWDDQSGNELRRWLGVEKEAFYNSKIFALMPIGFCYPGKGKSGDLPPRPECTPLWHKRILAAMKNIELTILIGQYAQQHYLGERSHPTITANVSDFKQFLPDYLPLVHPSPRNKIWQKKNPWFEQKVVPELQEMVRNVMVQRTL